MRIAPLVLLVFASHAEIGLAEFTFIGPTPYLSAADSPFAEYLDGPNFYLEDFEDGELNTPGIFQPLDPVTHAIVAGPSPFTDSVDGDDGLIDGSGNFGNSLASTFYVFHPIAPQQFNFSFIRFAFDETTLGGLPNVFGFALTDAQQDSGLRIRAFRQEEIVGELEIANGLGGDLLDGETADDVFVAMRLTEEFDFVEITSTYFGEPLGFEIDHVQYGMTVPEPPVVALMLAGLPCFFAGWRCRRSVRDAF